MNRYELNTIEPTGDIIVSTFRNALVFILNIESRMLRSIFKLTMFLNADQIWSIMYTYRKKSIALSAAFLYRR